MYRNDFYRFSINTQSDLRVNSHYGYGKSLIDIKNSLTKAKVKNLRFIVEHNSPKSNVQMYYGPHPVHNSHYAHQYKIHMGQVESSRFEFHKVNIYNSVDEFWTASEWGKLAAANSGVNPDKVFVYHHGLNVDQYPAYLRGKRNKLRFLHIDSGSPRKRSDLVEDAFNILFSENKDIELTLKYSHGRHGGKSWLNEDLLAKGGTWVRPGTRHINETMSQEELIALIHFHDVLVYPSEGEGFGLIPLEALATGMPVISTHEWAPYAYFFSEGHLASELKRSEIDWGYNKVGESTITSVDNVFAAMKFFYENIETLSNTFFDRSYQVKEDFDWNFITTSFFEKVVDRVGDLMLIRK
jgi:glycosyltransferase involved in cell wall biosynthesis